MVTAVVLLQVDRQRVNEIAEELAALEAVSEAYSVTGQYDVVAVLRVRSNEHLAAVATGEMLKIEGIESSETMLALQVHSRHDLEAMFSIGFDE
jgi:DNA-binding Lrp family transcriptional regulator